MSKQVKKLVGAGFPKKTAIVSARHFKANVKKIKQGKEVGKSVTYKRSKLQTNPY